MPLPDISVVIPCYNAETFIARTLFSVVEQSGCVVEILVVNDGSTDETKAILKPFQNDIKYFELPNSGGPSRPRNVGVANASSDLIAFCDADDLMLPGKLAAAVNVFLAHPNIDFLFTNFQKCDENDTVTISNYLVDYHDFRAYLKPTGGKNLSMINGPDMYRCLLRANFIGTSSVVCRANVLAAYGKFDETMPNSEDIDLWRRIARHGHNFGFLDEVYHSYRYRNDSISRGGSNLFPAWIKGFESQVSYCSDPDDLIFLKDKIHGLWLGYGYALRIEGKHNEAKKAYRTALEKKYTWRGLKGLLLCSLGL